MGLSRLRQLLEDKLLEENIFVTIPTIFLPPRFRKISGNRNMVLFMDIDATLHVRWEGTDLLEHRPLTKRACTRLIHEVLQNMNKYRRDLAIYTRFLETWADDPEPADRYEDSFYKRTAPSAKENPEVTGPEIIAKFTPEDLSKFMGGGESPMPAWDW